MSRTVATPNHHLTPRARPNSGLLAAALVAALVAGGAAISYSEDFSTPAQPDAARPAPLTFGDPPVVKGARGGKTTLVTLPVFGDPTVRKGAGGR